MIEKPKKTDIAYIAGIIDGEGSIYTKPQLPRKESLISYDIVLEIRMADKEALELIQAVLGGKINCRKPLKKNWKPTFQWKVSGRTAQEILKLIKPYLLVKRSRAELALKILGLHPRYKRYSPMERFLQKADVLAMKQLNKRGA